MSETIYFIEGRPVFPSFEQQASYRYLCRHPPFDGRSSPAFDAGFANPTAACPYRSSSFAAARFHAGQTVARDFGDRATATPGSVERLRQIESEQEPQDWPLSEEGRS